MKSLTTTILAATAVAFIGWAAASINVNSNEISGLNEFRDSCKDTHVDIRINLRDLKRGQDDIKNILIDWNN